MKQNVQPITSNQNRPNRDRQEKSRSKGKFLVKEKDVDEKPVRPSEKVSLFAFLEDKLPLNDSLNTAKTASSTETQSYPKNQSLNVNRQSDSQNKPYNQQNYNDKRPPNQNRYEKNSTQQNANQNSVKLFEKQQSNHFSRQSYQDRQDNVNSNPRQYERPRQQNRSEGTSNSKTPQGNYDSQKEDVNDLSNSVSKLSLNSQFASRSLRQHLNLGANRKSEEPPKRGEIVQNNVFNIGDECMAKYWEDGKVTSFCRPHPTFHSIWSLVFYHTGCFITQ